MNQAFHELSLLAGELIGAVAVLVVVLAVLTNPMRRGSSLSPQGGDLKRKAKEQNNEDRS